MILKKIVLTAALACSVAACATKSENISPSYVEPGLYSDFSCKQMAQEAMRLSERASIATGQQDRNHNRDTLKTTVGVIFFWPTLLFIEGDGVKSNEVAHLKGRMDALEYAAIRRNCNFNYVR
jgi:hypothetical protein